MLSTAKTVAGYLYSLLDRYTPIDWGSGNLSEIYNYLEYWPGLTTSGQPNSRELQLIADAGFDTIVNLAPHDVENALPNEAARVQELGMSYHHIPVNFKKPTSADFKKFVAVVSDKKDQQLWVHCAANMRVSAFMYCYRCQILGEDAELAKLTMHKIWQPIGVWKRFVASPQTISYTT